MAKDIFNSERFYLKELLFQSIDANGPIKLAGWTKGGSIKDEVPRSIHHDLFKTAKKETEATGIEHPDLANLELFSEIYSLLNYQPKEVLQEKYKRIHEPFNYIINTVPKYLPEKSCLKWARMAIWTEPEAIWLSMGFIPHIMFRDGPPELKSFPFYSCPVFEEYFERLELFKKAKHAEKIDKPSDPVHIMRWFRRLDFELPDNLYTLVMKFQSDEPRLIDNANENERKSLMKLVAGMAIAGYRFKPKAKRNQATSDIQADLDKLGIPLDQKTILKWLREASELVDEKDII